MGASAGYGQAVHDGRCAMHKLGSQILPCFSPNLMAIMGCKVAMLSTGSEDMLAYYTANEFATGFKKSLAFLLCGIKQSSRTEARHARPPGSPNGNLAAHAPRPM